MMHVGDGDTSPRWAAPVLLAAAALASCAARPGAGPAPGVERAPEDIRRLIAAARDRVFPALVNIHVVTARYWGGQERKGRAVGSGTIISTDGYVVTNQHVTRKGQRFRCTLADKREVRAELIGEDPLTDLAVLRLDLAELPEPAAPLPVAGFGDSDSLQVGELVMAMGSPFALARSVTLGIVSNPRRVFAGPGGGGPDSMELDAGQRTGLFTRWIQHDALIRPGSSGGPLVNLRGEVVGVNELGGAGMGFAIPGNLARTVVDALIAHGEVTRSWIGVSFKHIQQTGLTAGVLIDSVVNGGPGDAAGLRAGDVLVALAGEAITARFVEEIPPLMKRIADLPIGTELALSYQRDGATHETTVTTERFQKDRGDETAFRSWGLTAQEITEKLARDLRLQFRDGVLVTGARSGGPAQLAEPPLNRGDVIRVLDGQPVRTLPELVARYQEILSREPLPEFVLVEFDRHGKNYLTLLKPKPEDLEDPPREVRKAWIGVATQPVLGKLARTLGQPELRGFRVVRVYPGTRAAETGLAVGDVITALDGEPVRPRGMQDAGLLARRVRRKEIGAASSLTVRRGEATQAVAVTLEPTRLTPQEARRDRNEDFELTVRELTFFDRDERHWPESVQGVLVEQVTGGGWASLGGLRPGALIQRIQGEEIRTLDEYRAAMAAVTKAQPDRVVIVVLRRARTHVHHLEPEWQPKASEPGAATETKETTDAK